MYFWIFSVKNDQLFGQNGTNHGLQNEQDGACIALVIKQFITK